MNFRACAVVVLIAILGTSAICFGHLIYSAFFSPSLTFFDHGVETFLTSPLSFQALPRQSSQCLQITRIMRFRPCSTVTLLKIEVLRIRFRILHFPDMI